MKFGKFHLTTIGLAVPVTTYYVVHFTANGPVLVLVEEEVMVFNSPYTRN